MSVDQFEEAKEANQKWKYSNERTSKSWQKVEATALQKIELRVDKGTVPMVHVLCGWLASSYPIQHAFFQHISRICHKQTRVLAISHQGMARLLYGCLFILQIQQWHWTWKAFLSTKNHFYLHRNITIIIKGKSETCRISEIAIIILSLKFIGSFEAAAFSFTTELVFPT